MIRVIATSMVAHNHKLVMDNVKDFLRGARIRNNQSLGIIMSI